VRSRIHRGRSVALYVAFAFASLHGQEMTWDNDFTRGLRGWSVGGNSSLKREGATLYLHLAGPKADGIAECRSPLLSLDGAEHEYELTCTYRTDVEHSHLHGGAWFIFYKLDGDEKQVGDWTGLVLKTSANWTSAGTTVTIPAGVKTFQAGIRVQGREGGVLDVRTVSLKRVR